MSAPRFPRLFPAQVCFVVEDVDAAIEECVSRFGWGPFHRFDAPVAEAHYGDWTGPKHTDVGLGMAGDVQVELIHVRRGQDTVATYQSRYGIGFQHLGISCRDREEAIAALEGIGGVVDDRGEYPGIRFAFLDTPTGPGMFELLQPGEDQPPPGAEERGEAGRGDAEEPVVVLDRATIVTRDLDRALAFHARAFRWDGPVVETCALRLDGVENRVRRVRGRAGQLLLELIEPASGAHDRYARHLERGDHGLVHAGGQARSGAALGAPVCEGTWLEEGEGFQLHDWAGGVGTLQVREATA